MWISVSKERFYDMGDMLDIFVGKNKVGELRVVNIVRYIGQDIQEIECEVTNCGKMYKATFEMFTNKNGYVGVMVRKN